MSDQRCNEAMAIVVELAQLNPEGCSGMLHDPACHFCGEEDNRHAPLCLWRRAVRLALGAAPSKAIKPRRECPPAEYAEPARDNAGWKELIEAQGGGMKRDPERWPYGPPEAHEDC